MRAAFGVVVLLNSFFEIIGAADVERPVGALEDVYIVGHEAIG